MKQYGFAIIELVIVFMIIGILAAIAIPAYNQHIKDAKALEAANLTLQEQTLHGVFLIDNMTCDEKKCQITIPRNGSDLFNADRVQILRPSDEYKKRN